MLEEVRGAPGQKPSMESRIKFQKLFWAVQIKKRMYVKLKIIIQLLVLEQAWACAQVSWAFDNKSQARAVQRQAAL